MLVFSFHASRPPCTLLVMHNLLRRIWQLVGVFGVMAGVVSACLMTMEIVAGRLLAPFVGVSIIPWASVLAVVMVAMALGYYLGGVGTRRGLSLRAMGIGVCVAALWIAVMSPLAYWLGTHLLTLPWSLATTALLLSTMLLFVPASLLAAVHPCLMARVVTERESTGQTVGTLNACAAIGSIVGTFLTGFVGLMWLALPTIFYMTAGLLSVVGLGMLWVRQAEHTSSVQFAITHSRPKTSYAVLACVTGFVLMALEVAAARALAPYLGVSIFTWTIIIGAVLIGITLGNVLGGILADREGLPARLGHTLTWAGVAVLVATCLVGIGGPIFVAVDLPLALRTVLFAIKPVAQ